MFLRVQKGGTALHEASKAGHLEVVLYLCSRNEGGKQLLMDKTPVSFVYFQALRGSRLPKDEGQQCASCGRQENSG